ncbi:hypothetical protein CEXT_430031 [Caerostris extrusa]|uniref:Uncharacterized protein n=1 Tax=Caerostris extrusa TaxID=172846 RepID=A0AAV4U563_CAEEX|nr:hypothetical protein CEXT_430031 [Caerostris extrusa]
MTPAATEILATRSSSEPMRVFVDKTFQMAPQEKVQAGEIGVETDGATCHTAGVRVGSESSQTIQND